MLEKLLGFERELFLTINNCHTDFLDNALWLSTGLYIWIPFMLFFLTALIYGKPLKEWLPIVSFILVMALVGHMFVAGFFKPFFTRPRPVFHPDFMNEIITYGNYTGGGMYGFISGHSTFAFALAMFTSLVFRYRPYTVVAFLWSAVIAYSRIYFGVHFLSDVMAGFTVGLINGTMAYWLYQWYVSRFVYKDIGIEKCKSLITDIYSHRWKQVVTSALACYMAVFFVFSGQLTDFLA